jgi:hypothetical protein
MKEAIENEIVEEEVVKGEISGNMAIVDVAGVISEGSLTKNLNL